MANYSNIRIRDVKDIGSIDLSNEDITTLEGKLDYIKQQEILMGLNIELAIKQNRQDLIQNKYGERFSSIEEIVSYAFDKYNVVITPTLHKQWKNDLENLLIKPERIVVAVISLAIEKEELRQKKGQSMGAD